MALWFQVSIFKLKSTTKIHWMTAPFGLITTPLREPTKAKWHKFNDLPRFLWKALRTPECGFYETAMGAANLVSATTTTSSPTAHYKLAAWTPATPGWTEPAKQFQTMPAEGKIFFSLQERVSNATDMCCWPSSARCSIRLCWGLGTHRGDHLAPLPWPHGLSRPVRPAGSRKVEFTPTRKHSQRHQLFMADEPKIQLQKILTLSLQIWRDELFQN